MTVDLQAFVRSTGARIVGGALPTTASGWAHDTRRLQPGEAFVALRTPWGDGHAYLEDAARRGAVAALVEQLPDGSPPLPLLHVEDVRAALYRWARDLLAHTRMERIAVTGSVGKTGTKEAVAAVLAGAAPTFRTPASYNDALGIPLALGGYRGEPYGVFELGIAGRGEMAALLELVRPRVGILTWIGAAHLDALGSVEGVRAEKGRLLEALPAGGLALLNGDAPLAAELAKGSRAPLWTYGTGEGNRIRGRILGQSFEGTEVEVRWPDGRRRLRLRRLGLPALYNALAAWGVALFYGLDLERTAAILEGLDPLPGRLRPLPGARGIWILDDTFSGAPPAFHAALTVLEQAAADRPRAALFGGVEGAGPEEERWVQGIGERAARTLELLVAVGPGGERLARAARRTGGAEVHVVETPEQAVELLRRRLPEGAALLVKGSREEGLERAVAALLAEPREAPRLLVRQGPAWVRQHPRPYERPTWVELDLEALTHNVRLLKEALGPGVEILATVKADAYGHGAVRVARTALQAGVLGFGVACLSEGIALRQAGIEAPVLILGYLPPWQAREAVRWNLSVACFSADLARALSEAARALGRPARVHVKVDTGMGRLGLAPEEVPPFVRFLRGLDGLTLEGLFTHLATADEEDPEGTAFARWQLRRFEEVRRALAAEGVAFRWVHAANSAAALRFPEARYNLVRPGLALYGVPPFPGARGLGLRPVLSFKTVVARVRTFPPGTPIGYGRAYVTPDERRIATLPVGYADGFRRGPRPWPAVLIRGRRAPLVGRVCMDYAFVDVTHIPGVREGDEVVLIGRQGEAELSAEEVAEALGTIPYEVLSQILARVPRLV